MKEISGAELAGYIKERQAKEVRRLKQSKGVDPKLAIIITGDDAASHKYASIKQRYADDIGIGCEIYRLPQSAVPEMLDEIRKDDSIQGVIIQLPLENPQDTDEVLALLPSHKDIDGLGPESQYDPATPTAINWLLSGYSISLNGKNLVILGQGRLVGGPLGKMWRDSGYDPVCLDENSSDDQISLALANADILVTAVGSPGIVKASDLTSGTVVIDAGVSSDNGQLIGDVADDVRDLDDIVITPKVGGVGPLTVAALFENLLTACQKY